MKLPGGSTSVGSRVGKIGLPVTKRLVPPQISRVGSFGGSRPKLPLSSSTSTIPTTSRLTTSTSSIPSSRFVSATAARATPSLRLPSSTLPPTIATRPKVTSTTTQTQSAPTILVTAVVEPALPFTAAPPVIIEDAAVPPPIPIIVVPSLPQLPRPLPKAVDNTSSPKRRALRVWEAPDKVNIFSSLFF